jgi:hypothetical protein
MLTKELKKLIDFIKNYKKTQLFGVKSQKYLIQIFINITKQRIEYYGHG